MFKGIDVSTFQKFVDWVKVKIFGIQFVIIRASFGWDNPNQKDKMFEDHYKGAKNAGLNVGAYHYSYATTVDEAQREAKFFLECIKGKTFEYPVVFDIEDVSQSNLSRQQISDIIRAFCETVEAAGYYVAIYANKSWLDNKIDDDCKNRYDIWVAQWTSKCTYNGVFGMWQYTSDGTVDGYSGRLDMNEAYKDYPLIMLNNGYNGVEKHGQPVTPTPPALKSNSKIANEVLGGQWGNGDERKQKLAEAGYDYDAIQTIVNERIYAQAPKVEKGSRVKVKNGARDYNGGKVAKFVYNGTFTVTSLEGNRAVLDERGGICTPFNVSDLVLQ